MTCKIKSDRGHFVVHINGRFYCTADNMREAVKEVEDYIKERGVVHENKSTKQNIWCNRAL